MGSFSFSLKALNISESTDAILGPTGSHIISAIGNQLNGYADKTQNVLSDMLNKTAPAAQKLKEKTMNPFPSSENAIILLKFDSSTRFNLRSKNVSRTFVVDKT